MFFETRKSKQKLTVSLIVGTALLAISTVYKSTFHPSAENILLKQRYYEQNQISKEKVSKLRSPNTINQQENQES